MEIRWSRFGRIGDVTEHHPEGPSRDVLPPNVAPRIAPHGRHLMPLPSLEAPLRELH